jgi:hypothetical protein
MSVVGQNVSAPAACQLLAGRTSGQKTIQRVEKNFLDEQIFPQYGLLRSSAW